MSERSRTVVRCAVGQTEEFKVEVGLHQGSALSPFLFAIVMDQLSEEVRQESPWTMMFADDIVICSESREQVAENLERWRFALERRGMKGLENRTRGLQYNLQIKKAQAMLSKELPVAVAQDVCSQSSRNMSTQTTRRILDHQHLAPNDHSPTELYMNHMPNSAAFFSSNTLTKMVTKIVVCFFIFWIPVQISNIVIIIAALLGNDSLLRSAESGDNVTAPLTFINR
ncbi:hypothetical protein QTP70_012906 [Hemibagrus guttatus]|uniref:ribonuclease H n=1 Tax=Hemibagrus guttatus TaxID=175788 RepID=A0AAE0UNW4_9TELE|nr:hypothetical protein QTP70_012906 [Hemibagrus guttatus]